MDTKKLRQKILDLAIHGKLVPQDPNDEPASVLLERIRAEKAMLIKEGKIKAPKKSKSAGDTSHYPKDVPFDVPEGWVWCKIGDIADVARGGSPRPIDSYLTDDSSGVNWIKIGDAEQGGKYINSTRQRIKIEGVSRSRFVHSGDFLLTNSMSFGRPYILNVDGCIHDGWLVISPINNALYKDFFYYLLSSDYAYQQFSEQASGAVVSNLNKDKVADALIPLPSLSEQKRIVDAVEKWLSILDLIDDGQSKLYELADDAKEKVLNLAIHGKLVPQDPSDEPAIELLKRINPDFKASDNLHYEGELPNGWCFSTIGDLFRHNTGKALNGKDQVGEELRYITTSNLYWDRFDLNEVRTMPFTEAEKEKCRATKGDLLVCEGGDVGRAAIWPHDFDVMIQNHIHRLRPREDISVRFYYYIFLLYKQMGLIGGKGIAILGLSSRELDKMVVPVPPVPEQHRIVTVIENLFAQMDALISNLS